MGTLQDGKVVFAPAEAPPATELRPEGWYPGQPAADSVTVADPAPEQPDRPAHDIGRPPKRMPARTKQLWLSIAPEVREDIWEREAAFDKAHARYDGLGQFAIGAEQAGVSLADWVKALVTANTGYQQWEAALRQDPLGAAIQAWQALGIPPEGIRQLLERVGAGHAATPASAASHVAR